MVYLVYLPLNLLYYHHLHQYLPVLQTDLLHLIRLLLLLFLHPLHLHRLHPQPHRLHPLLLPRLHPQLARLHPQPHRLHPQLARLHPQPHRLHPQLLRFHPQLPGLHPQLPRHQMLLLLRPGMFLETFEIHLQVLHLQMKKVIQQEEAQENQFHFRLMIL